MSHSHAARRPAGRPERRRQEHDGGGSAQGRACGQRDYVADPVVRRRYQAGLTNLFGCYQDVVDSWQVYDNSALGTPRLIAAMSAGQGLEITDPVAWQYLKERVP